MDTVDLFSPIPVCELDEGEVRCTECKILLEEAYWDGDAWYCEGCINALAQVIVKEAESYALESCKITRPLAKYDARYEYRPTPEEYNSGAKEAYTENAHRAHCRHNCTNYDELIKTLSKYSEVLRDKVYYEAIRKRIDELLDDAIGESGSLEDEEFED
jgi:hypothetical protein